MSNDRKNRSAMPDAIDCSPAACPLETPDESSRSPDALAAAYFLAQGSFGTARDNGIRLMVQNESQADEFKRLASNFQRIAELIEMSGCLHNRQCKVDVIVPNLGE